MGKLEVWKEKLAKIYFGEKRDWDEFFRTLTMAMEESGIENILIIWEEMVWFKRKKWLDANINSLSLDGNPVKDGFKIFYETYLNIHPDGKDGRIVEISDTKIVSEWWNECPVLEYCKKYGLDTRLICRKVYHKPTEQFFKRISPKLNFDRNYEKIRPYAPFCEEIIWVEE